MQSIAYIPASDGGANASLMTVQTARAKNASTILVNTVANVPAKFYASMGTPHTFTDPVTGETITVIAESTAVDFAGSVSGGSINIDAIAPGYTDNGSKVGDIIVIRPNTEWANNIFNVMNASLNDDGSIKPTALPTIADHILSGGIWTALTGLNAGMTAAVAYQANYRGAAAAIATRAFTASKDTYVDLLRTTTTAGVTSFAPVYTEVANAAAAPTLAANSIRIAKVTTGASTITGVTQYGIDSLNNTIKPNGGVSFSNIDANGLFLNVRSIGNPSQFTTGTGDINFGSNCQISFTVSTPCVVYASVNIALLAAGDSEFRPEIWLDGVLYHSPAYAAASGFTNGRGVQRSTSFAVPIPTAGTHIISAGAYLNGTTGYTINSGASELTLIILGKVTA